MHFVRSQKPAGMRKKGILSPLILFPGSSDVFYDLEKVGSVKNAMFLFNILREWILPPSCLSTAEDVLCSVPGVAVEVSSVIKRCFLLQ